VSTPPVEPPPPAASPSPGGESSLGGATYETALSRVEDIIRRLDGGEAGLRETLELVQEGRSLIEFCARELEAVGRGLEELRLEELVARLESAPPAPPGERGARR
jgi:exodeoxyribonuclease VII small subunit